MAIDVSLPLNDALDLGWQTMAECFAPEELLMREHLIAKYFPKHNTGTTAGATDQATSSTHHPTRTEEAKS
jgi:V/A-type H+-transporting ATPase subunit B